MKKIYYLIKNLIYFFQKIKLIYIASKENITLILRIKILFLFFFHFFFNLLFINRKYKYYMKNFRENFIKFKFSHDWFSDNIPIWKYIFNKNKLNDVTEILEIGSFEGMSALFLLKNFENSKIDCVETFKGSDEHGDISFKKVKNNFLFNLKDYEKKFHLFERESDFFFQNIDKSKKNYDLIYIDGSHHGEQVFRDAKNCFDCLKLNGIMIFDDFLKEYYNEKHENTIGGVLNFIQKYKDKINIEFVHYQIFLKKKHN